MVVYENQESSFLPFFFFSDGQLTICLHADWDNPLSIGVKDTIEREKNF